MKGDISPRMEAGTLLFSGYDEAWIGINQHRYPHGICLHQGKLTEPWGPTRLRDLGIEHLQPIAEQPPEVLILGTGRLTAFPSAEVLAWLQQQPMGFECMDSRAAARTYNILIGEGRRVTIAMLLPGARN